MSKGNNTALTTSSRVPAPSMESALGLGIWWRNGNAPLFAGVIQLFLLSLSFYGSIQSMIRYPAVQFIRRYVWVQLLLCLLVLTPPSIGNAEETISRIDEVREVLGQALEAATRIQNPFHRKSIIDDIAASYAVAGDPDRALELAERKDNESRNYTLVTISRALFEQGHGRQVAGIISHITDDDGKAWTLRELGRYHIAKGEQGEAKERLDQALKSAEGHYS